MILLGVNIDHAATLRQARYRPAGAAMGGNIEPDPVALALLCKKAGADGITVHLRDDRRRIHPLYHRRIHAHIGGWQSVRRAGGGEFLIHLESRRVCARHDG